MFNQVQKPVPSTIEVIIGPQSTFSGTLRSDNSIRIDGAIEGGLIETLSNVVLTETSRVQANIVAKTVSIRGVYQGTLQADRVELLEGSQIYGALYVNSYFMDDGVLLSADLNLLTSQQQTALPSPNQAEVPSAIPVITPPGTPPS